MLSVYNQKNYFLLVGSGTKTTYRIPNTKFFKSISMYLKINRKFLDSKLFL